MNKQFLPPPLRIICLAVLFAATPAYSNNNLVVYPAPKGALLNADFSVQVRQSGNKWNATPAYLVKVDEVRGTTHHIEEASMSYFDFSGEVEVSVTYNRGPIETARVRPLSLGIAPQISGNTLTFKLNKACNLSVEVNNDIFHNLHLFANPLETHKPNLKDKNTIYFGPGIHQFEENRFRVPSGKTVYLSGGAILMGQLLIEDVENVKVLGRGMVDHTVKHGIRIANSKNIVVEGLFATQCSTGGSDDVTIRNVKSISYYGWGDGMNVFASNNVLFDGVFCRNSDDCTTVYGTRLGFKGGCRNITMQNSTLWADVAHPIFIGIHGDTENPEVLEELNYINIDILDHKEKQVDYQGCLAINAGDNNLIRNVRFENIRIEDFRQGQLVNLRIFYNQKYCTAPGRGIENVLFKDISYTGNRAELSIIAGYNEERKIKNIRFENLRINGELITDDMPGKPTWYKTADMARFSIGEHVEGVEFINVKTIQSLEELTAYASQSGNRVKLAPGTYKMIEFLNADSIAQRLERKQYPYLDFSGSNNTFDFEGVKLEIDTKLRELLRHPIHTNEIVLSGDSNILKGLEIIHIGDGLSPGGAAFCVDGRSNTISGFTLHVRGSFPYGYGDLFGKGGPDVIRHKKHSGFLVTGSYNNIVNCMLYMRSFGHGFYIQKAAGNLRFENCYIEGEVRSTDDVLKETEGPAFDVDFRTWTSNREGKYVVTPGYMKSLCEDGFRTYGQNENITFINCTAKHTRAGFELRTNGGVRLENCTTIGTERAYWVGNGAVLKNCKGDANYGPLLFLEGSNVDVELDVLPGESDRIVHALATIQGRDNKVILRAHNGENRKQLLPVLIGYTHPEHGEAMSPYSEASCVGLHLINETRMPVVLGTKTENCIVGSNGKTEGNKGRNNTIKNL